MSNQGTEPLADGLESDEPLDEVLAETGNYPLPDDGPQDDVDQSALPQYDEDLIDGADLSSS